LTLIDLLLWFSAVSFLFYGTGCFTSNFMVNEFVRYGIPQFRKLTGILQLLGALGIIVGFWADHLQLMSTLGLSLLMLFGVITRIMIKDGLMKTFPALFYCLLNAYLGFELAHTL
jgi:intracellular septation protein A